MNEQDLKRLSDCEVLITTYHNQLQDFFHQVVNYNQQIISKDDFKVYMTELNQRHLRDLGLIRKDADENLLNQKDLSHKVEELKLQMSSHRDMINRQGAHLEQLLSHSESANIHHASHERKLAHLESKMPNWEKFSLEYREYREKFLNFMDESVKKLDFFESNLEKLRSELEQKKISDNALTSWVQQLEKKLKENADCQNSNYDQCSQNNSKSYDDLRKFVNNCFENLPKPEAVVFPDFSTMLDERENAILQKFSIRNKVMEDAAELSKLNELQMVVLDKKLDKILNVLSQNNLM